VHGLLRQGERVQAASCFDARAHEPAGLPGSQRARGPQTPTLNPTIRGVAEREEVGVADHLQRGPDLRAAAAAGRGGRPGGGGVERVAARGAQPRLLPKPAAGARGRLRPQALAAIAAMLLQPAPAPRPQGGSTNKRGRPPAGYSRCLAACVLVPPPQAPTSAPKLQP
jgi:hypothetical protein